MKKLLHIHIVAILFLFLAACNGQNQTVQQTEKTNQKEMVLVDNLPILEVDTIWSTNAPSRITRKIRKDKEGNLLFASYTDIIKYNGTHFTKFDKTAGLVSFDAFDVWQDNKGSTWIASTLQGVFKYPKPVDSKNDKNYYHFTTKNGLAHNRTMCIYEDMAGGIWIGTEEGISYFDGKPKTGKQLDIRNLNIEDGLTNSNINTIMEDNTGKMWIGTRGALSIHDPIKQPETEAIKFKEIKDNNGKTFENVWSIIQDNKGDIWIGGHTGLWRYDGTSFSNLSTTNIFSVYEDKKGNVWYNHGHSLDQKGGLSCYDHKSLLAKDPKSTQIYSGENMYFGLTEDKYGDIWVGQLDGVFRYDGKSVHYYKDAKLK